MVWNRCAFTAHRRAYVQNVSNCGQQSKARRPYRPGQPLTNAASTSRVIVIASKFVRVYCPYINKAPFVRPPLFFGFFMPEVLTPHRS